MYKSSSCLDPGEARTTQKLLSQNTLLQLFFSDLVAFLGIYFSYFFKLGFAAFFQLDFGS